MRKVVYYLVILLGVSLTLSCGRARSFVGLGGPGKKEHINPVNDNQGDQQSPDTGNNDDHSEEGMDSVADASETEGEAEHGEMNAEEGDKPHDEDSNEDPDADIELSGDEPWDGLKCDPDAPGVVRVTGDDDDLNLTSDSVVHLILKGNSFVELEADDLSMVKGLCIEAYGDARAQVELDMNVESMTYIGRGNAAVSLSFGDDGSFSKIEADIRGNHSLNIHGENIDCSLLNTQIKGGASAVSCAGN